MFTGPTVWRGIIYTILMTTGKLLCGVWLLPFASLMARVHRPVRALLIKQQSKSVEPGDQCARRGESSQKPSSPGRQDGLRGRPGDIPLQPARRLRSSQEISRTSPSEADAPVSIYPACMLAVAMVARGEIGYLISALAESSGVFGREGGNEGEPSELFLVVTWAITICTIIGPVSVGLFVRRVRKLESQDIQGGDGGRRNVLGGWGVS